MTGSRAEADAGKGPAVGEGKVFEVFTDGAGKPEVVVFPCESFIKPLERGTADRKERKRRKR
jgi:hypothetical protein